VLWRALRPGGLEPDAVRAALTGSVFYLFLPALSLSVLWKAELGAESLGIAGVAALGVAGGLALGWLAARLLRLGRAATGALLLAAGFPNAVYLGLPVLDRLLGETGRSIAIQYDLFACMPILLTFGVWLAQRYGGRSGGVGDRLGPLAVPSFWAGGLGVLLNLGGVAPVTVLDDWLLLLGAAVSPLMLFALGLSLRLQAVAPGRLPALGAVALIQLGLVPALAIVAAPTLGLDGDLLLGTVLEAAMPAMVLGIVFCDRYGLDTGLFAGAVSLTTLLSLITLPLWHAALV
jgi:predicted permease